MKNRRRAIGHGLLSLVLLAPLWAQSASDLTSVLRRSGMTAFAASSATGSVSVRVSLQGIPLDPPASAPSQAASARAAELRELKRHNEAVRQERFPQVADGMIVAVAVDQAGRAIFWKAQNDPRRVRAEFPGPGGVLTGAWVLRPEADLFLDLPADPLIREVHLYRAFPGTSGIELARIGTAAYPGVAQ